MLSVPSSATTVSPEERASRSAPRATERGGPRKLWWFTALALAGAGLGASVVHTPVYVSSHVHSGSPGYKQTPNGKDLHWEKKALTVHLDDSLQKLGPNAGDAVMQAFGQWVASDPRLPDLSFETGKSSAVPKQDGNSTVSYGRITVPGHEHDLAITLTYSNDQTGEILEADIILNALYPMAVLTPMPATPVSTGLDASGDDRAGSTSGKSMHDREESLDCKNRYDTQNVTTHEAGHFFGLGEDPVERRATMFQTIDQCETHKRVLSTTDIGAISTLYAESADPEEAKAGPRACSFGGVPAGGGALWVSAAIFGFGLWRRRRAG